MHQDDKPKHAPIAVGRTKKYERVKQVPLGVEHQEQFVPHYVPHPTKTMWERHLEMHNIEDEHKFSKPNQHGLHIDLGPRTKAGDEAQASRDYLPHNIKPIQQVMEEVTAGREFSNGELRWHFGFTKDMVRRFRSEQAKTRKWLSMTEEQRRKIEIKEATRLGREERMIDMRLTHNMTYEEIGAAEGVTRERVRQILQQCEKRYSVKLLGWERDRKRDTPILEVAMACKVCAKRRVVKESETHRWINNFCDEHRMGKYGFNMWEKHGLEWWALDDKARARARYNHDPVKKQKAKIASVRWLARMRSDPEKYKDFWDKYKAYHKKWSAEREAKRKAALIRPYIETPDPDMLPRLDSNQEPPL